MGCGRQLTDVLIEWLAGKTTSKVASCNRMTYTDGRSKSWIPAASAISTYRGLRKDRRQGKEWLVPGKSLRSTDHYKPHLTIFMRNASLTLWSINFIYTIFKNSVPNSQHKQHISMTKAKWLILLREIIAVYSENFTKFINKFCG
jgi:hypothetical protein